MLKLHAYYIHVTATYMKLHLHVTTTTSNIFGILHLKTVEKSKRFTTKSCQKECQNCIPFLESTYPEMQRKHIPKVYEYQS